MWKGIDKALFEDGMVTWQGIAGALFDRHTLARIAGGIALLALARHYLR